MGGCSASKLDKEEVVQLCKDRRNFIKQAVDHRTRFASGHIAYLQSLKRVSVALHNFVDGQEHHDFLLDSYNTPPFSTPVKRLSPQIISVPLKSFTPTPPKQSAKSTVHVMKYLRSNANPSVSVEERPQPAQTVRIDSYYPPNPYNIDGFFAMESSQVSPSFYPSPYHRPNYPPPSPQNSQWDLFWNPFSSMDTYGYPSRLTIEDEMARLRQVREEEGIPDLEEDDGEEEGHIVGEEEEEEEEDTEEEFIEVNLNDKASNKIDPHPSTGNAPNENVPRANDIHEIKGLQSRGLGSIEVAKEQNAVELEVTRSKQEVMRNREPAEETPGFTVYVNRRHSSMREVMKEINEQFVRICDCAQEVSTMLEASRAQYSSTSSEISASRMLNPVTLFHSASSRSTSSRSFLASSSSRDDSYESSSDYSEESSMESGSHQSTLDRLYAWEKKLYQEVKSGERIRMAYEKKCKQLRNQDVTGEEPSSVHKTRAAARDLYTKLKVSVQTVESISKRIDALRDEELHPQLRELIQGLARMWRTMADCHQIQKRAIDEAKVLHYARTSFPPPRNNPKLPHRNLPESATTSNRSFAGCALLLRLLDLLPALLRPNPRLLGPPLRGRHQRHRHCLPGPRVRPLRPLAQHVDAVSEAQAIDGLAFLRCRESDPCIELEKRRTRMRRQR
ncbi:uncharacterized protein A4U43_C01F6160 [Asparagus officinalis]|uniref:DUF632 domain-containing protein n=1 Tax=Asparagus officinalis TaxID=4686 RepID=A0A5P1FQZ9_ASPOF|nr:uncharacterized protein A4U43_C01F6160 [Asparagus officinalis]